MVIALATPVAAVQINWGNEVDSDLRDSFGNSLDATFAIQLGYFEKVLGQEFVPTAANTGSGRAIGRFSIRPRSTLSRDTSLRP